MHEVRTPPRSFARVMLFDDRDAPSRARARFCARCPGLEARRAEWCATARAGAVRGQKGRTFGSTRK